MAEAWVYNFIDPHFDMLVHGEFWKRRICLWTVPVWPTEVYMKGRQSWLMTWAWACAYLHRWDGGVGGSVADWDLPQWEERGDEQPAGCGQHGWSVLHAGNRNGSQPHYLCLGAPVLLETQILLYWRLHRHTRPALLHQQGKASVLSLRSIQN